MMAVTLLVMTVPEGLPMAVTLSLALNMRRMLKSNNLVRKLHACETMGAVTVICTDKTGTLTENKMQVAEMRVFAPETPLVDAIALNTTAHLETKDNATTGIGNPTEVALLLWLDANKQNYRELRTAGKVENQLPFSTERKYMATVASLNGQRYLFLKGAPETVMALCQLTDEERTTTADLLRSYQNKAMRTLAFAYKALPNEAETNLADPNLLQDLTLQAVAAISDPIRQDVPAAVKECIDAGIEVKIVTGDTAATAIEIARQIGIWHKDTPIEAQITGPDFAALSDEVAYERVKVLRVMSRARPTDKQRLVNLLQQRGEVVAVTGDGTNDAPALNHAHVGLSLGSGTNVAKEASDMTLLDDSFRSIERAVIWGRSLYNNIRRFLFFQLIVNLTALLLVLGGAIIGTQMPLTVTQILWVNLIMDTFAAMALASLPPTREVMSERPRKQTDPIISPSMARGIIFCGLVFFAMLFALLIYFRNESGGQVDTHQLTIFFTAFVMLQFWNLFNAKTLNSHHSTFRRLYADRGLLLVLLLILAGQWLIVTFGGRMFRTVPLSFTEWLAIIGATSIVLWVGEVWRRLKSKAKTTNPA
jgi:calcium-translocating P-type ATPase, PMCA-type